MVEFANLYLSVMSVQRDKVLLIWKLNILLSMAAYGGGGIGRTSPPQKKYFFLSNHKWPEFEIIQNPGGLKIFEVLRAPLPENPLPLEIFISRHDFTWIVEPLMYYV